MTSGVPSLGTIPKGADIREESLSGSLPILEAKEAIENANRPRTLSNQMRTPLASNYVNPLNGQPIMSPRKVEET